MPRGSERPEHEKASRRVRGLQRTLLAVAEKFCKAESGRAISTSLQPFVCIALGHANGQSTTTLLRGTFPGAAVRPSPTSKADATASLRAGLPHLPAFEAVFALSCDSAAGRRPLATTGVPEGASGRGNAGIWAFLPTPPQSAGAGGSNGAGSMEAANAHMRKQLVEKEAQLTLANDKNRRLLAAQPQQPWGQQPAGGGGNNSGGASGFAGDGGAAAGGGGAAAC